MAEKNQKRGSEASYLIMTEGHFITAIKKAYAYADSKNRRKLEQAFPDIDWES